MRLLEELIINKSTKLENNLYRKYFDEIFPDTQLFIDFLKASSDEQSLNYAKKIVEMLIYKINIPFSSQQLLIAINSEVQKRAQHKGHGYIGRDHTIHLVNVYLLGIYIFFNMPFLQEKLIDYYKFNTISDKFIMPNEQAVMSFLTSWRLFAMLHDIAYPFEMSYSFSNGKKIPNHNIINCCQNYKTKKIIKYICYEKSIRDFAQYSVLLYILQNYGSKLYDYINIHNLRYSSTNKKIDNCDEFKTYTEISNINNIFDYKYICDFLECKNIAILVENEHGCIQNIYIDSTIITNQNNIIHPINEASYNNIASTFTKRVFLKNITQLQYSVTKNMSISAGYEEELTKAAELAIQQFIICQDELIEKLPIQKLEYSFFIYLKSQYSLEDCYNGFRHFWGRNYEYQNINFQIERIENELSNFKKNVLENIGKDVTETDTTPTINDTWNSFKVLFEEWLKNHYNDKIDPKINEVSQKHQLIISTLEKIFNALYEKIKSTTLDINIKTDCIAIETMHINCNIKDAAQKEYIDQINKHLSTYLKYFDSDCDNIIENLSQYKTDKYLFDHGVISAHIIIALMSIRNIINNTISWCKTSMSHNIAMEDELFYIAIAAIAVHNIYLDDYNRQFNSKIKCSINNPFIYFSILCDTLQKWDRPSQENLAYSELKRGFYHDTYDLYIEENKIHIQFKSNYIAQHLNDIDTLLKSVEFISGINQILKIDTPN